ncbi:unnamed protein product [Lathyrus sativus]|nr:unnamed protein product [Lathyrus sativus]
MVYVKLAPLAVLILATICMYAKIEATNCWGGCSPFQIPPCGYPDDCRCIPWILVAGQCIDPIHSKSIVKMVEEHPYLCQSHGDCVKKGNGNFCGSYPNSEIQYGWCFSSKTKAKHFFTIGSKLAANELFNISSNSEAIGFKLAVNELFNISSNSKAKDFIKMAMEIST